MSTVKLEINLSLQELLEAVKELSESDLEQFLSQLIILHTQRKSSKLLTGNHVDISLKNNQRTNHQNFNYYSQLANETTEKLAETEYKELLRLSEQIDQFQAHRFEYLVYLAHLHGTSLIDLMRSLGFHT